MPDESTTKPLSQYCDANMQSLGRETPTEFRFRYIDLSSVNQGNIDWQKTRALTYANSPSRARRIVKPGDVLFSTVRPGLMGHGMVREPSDLPLIASTGFAVLSPKEGTDGRFLFHSFFLDEFKRQVAQFEVGSNYPAINESDLRRVRLGEVDGPSQTLIADILDAIDDAILETDAAIEKLRVIRSGMIDDLLSRGVGCSGRLRGVSETVSTSIGMKAAVWPLKPLGTLVELINGFAFKPNDWLSDGVPIIRIQNLNGGTDFNYTSLEVPDKYHVAPGELLFSWSGNRGTSFGPFIWRGPFGYVNQHIFRVIPKKGISHRWLYFALDEVRVRAERFAHGGSGLVHVKRSDLENYLVAVPEFDEQEEIADRLESIQSTVDRLSDERAKLSSLRGGLRDDLLTGRKPVLAIREAAE